MKIAEMSFIIAIMRLRTNKMASGIQRRWMRNDYFTINKVKYLCSIVISIKTIQYEKESKHIR